MLHPDDAPVTDPASLGNLYPMIRSPDSKANLRKNRARSDSDCVAIPFDLNRNAPDNGTVSDKPVVPATHSNPIASALQSPVELPGAAING
jgi:hypothetical protein